MKEDEIASVTTVPRIVDRIRAANPESPVSAYGIRVGIRRGDIPATRVGNRYMVTPEMILEYYTKTMDHTEKREKQKMGDEENTALDNGEKS